MAKKRKRKWLQKAAARMKAKGTAGSFTRWCKSQGFGGVTAECIAKGKASKNPAIRKKANFAANVHKIARRRKRKRK